MLRRSGEGGRTRRLAPALLPASGHTAHRRGGAEGPRRSSTEQTWENHTHTQVHVMQQSTSDSGRRRSGGGGGGASLTRASAGRLASGPCLRRCEDGRGRLRQAGDHHVHDGSDYPVRRGVREAARLRPDDVQARDGVHDDEDAAGVQLPLLPLPALRAPFGDMHSRMPPPAAQARRCVIRIFLFSGGRTACGLCRSYVCLRARRDGDARARARVTRRTRAHQHTRRRTDALRR